MLAQTMWTNILDSEVNKSSSMAPQTRVAMMSNKIKALGKLYASSQKYFPLGELQKDVSSINFTFLNVA